MKKSFEMVDVGEKQPTRRRALARGSLRMGRQAFRLLKEGRLPKGDALSLGEAAGILAAKRTPEMIPLCHPLPLDRVAVRFELDESLPGVHALCEASAFAKTGVEMEALSGVSGALLAVYDLVKQVDPALTISDIRLELKEGGKSGSWHHPKSAETPTAAQRNRPAAGRAATITVSDRCFYKKSANISGKLLAEGLREQGFEVSKEVVVPDEKEKIAKEIARLAKKSNAVILTGGTGLSPRDVTPEAVASVCDRMIPGIGEALRAAGAASTPMSSLSRSTAGLLGRTVVVSLPGSPGGVKDGLKVLAELLPHALHIAGGGGHP